MKIRNGFVSNSSSSSFIIGFDNSKNIPCPHCGRKDPDLIDRIRASEYANSGEATEIRSEDVNECFMDIHWYIKPDKNGNPIIEKPEDQKLYDEMMEYQKTTGKVYSVCVSYSDIFISDLIKECEKTGTVKIFYSSDD